MKEKLKQLLKECDDKVDDMMFACKTHEERSNLRWFDVYAEYLINNGVVILPCKAGDTVYMLGHMGVYEDCPVCKGVGEVDAIIKDEKKNKDDMLSLWW